MPPLPPIVREPRHWLMGPVYHVQRDPLRWISRWIADYGDVYTIKTPFGQGTVLGDPELARQVLADRHVKYLQKSRSYVVLRLLMGNGLVTSEGEFWRGQRRLVQPAFHRRRLDALFAMMVGRVMDFATQLGGSVGRAVDFVPQLSRLTLDIISRAMFSTDVGGAAANVSRHIATLNEYALLLLRNPWLFLLPPQLLTRFNPSVRALNAIVYSIIQSRRVQSGTHDDLLSMLLAACDEETGRGMTDEQLRDEVMTIFVAGHETTANDKPSAGHCASISASIFSSTSGCCETRYISHAMAIILYRHFRFRLEPGFVVERDPLITLRPKHGMRLITESRRTPSPLPGGAHSPSFPVHEAA